MDILVFFAHPDDETILAGGTLALLARAGVDVHYLCATRGEGGELGEPPLCTREELGHVRSKELACAVQTLGGKSLAFLDHKDPLVGDDDQLHPYTTDLDGLTQQVLTHIQLNRPEVVITHGSNGEYGHPAHVLTHQAARDAICFMNGGVPWLYTISPKFPDHPRPRLANQDNLAHLVLDVSSAMDQKEAAALCHRTQNALFVRRSSKKAGRKLNIREVLMRIEGLHRACPMDVDTQEDPMAALLQPWTI